MKKHQIVDRKCLECGTYFLAKHPSKWICTRDCYQKWWAKNGKKREVTCARCKKTVTVSSRYKARKYCSRVCNLANLNSRRPLLQEVEG